MPPIRVKYVVSFSSQDTRHTIDNLIKGSGSWLCQASDRTGRLQADLQLERATTINFLDLGNSGSVMISVEVGRSSWPSNQPFVTLLPTVALMTPAEWRAGKNTTSVRMFKESDFNSECVKEKWDKVRIVCTQPFRKDMQFGLSLFRLHTNIEVPSVKDFPTMRLNNDTYKAIDVETDMKKEELVMKMNLPATKKKSMSQSIGWLENKVLTKGGEPESGPPSNPLTSPVSRAARLVVMASKPTSLSEGKANKAALECEALEHLISLNLTMEDINTLKVSAVRRNFESKRQKELSMDEKVIFKDIALDYARERLNSLEAQQEKVAVKGFATKSCKVEEAKFSVKGKENKKHIPAKAFGSKSAVNTNTKYSSHQNNTTSASNVSQNKSTKDINSVNSAKRFTFKRLEKSEQKTPSPRSIGFNRLKLREEDNLDFSSSSGSSRNKIALGDSKVTTPKRSRSNESKSLQNTNRNGQTNLEGWFDCNRKRRKETPFTYSEIGIHTLSSDEEDIQEVDALDVTALSNLGSRNVEAGGFMVDPKPYIIKSSKDNTNSLVSDSIGSSSKTVQESDGGYCLGSTPIDKYGNHASHKDFKPSQECSNDASKIKCPLCLGHYEHGEIEHHAASCGIIISDCDTDMSDVEVSRNDKKTKKSTEDCPICDKAIEASSLEVHASACAASAFG